MKALAVIFIIVMLAGLFGLGYGALMGGTPDAWSPRSYTVQGSDCWVHPQGDPLYDAHYAQNVNVPNCNAYYIQEQAQKTEAETRQVDWNTNQGKFGVSVIFIVVVGVLFALVIMALKGG